MIVSRPNVTRNIAPTVVKVRKFARTNFARVSTAAAFGAVALTLAATGANAQTTGGTDTGDSLVDYSALAGTGKTEVKNAMTGFAPVVISILVGMIGFALLYKWLKRTKSA